ncbi:Cytochrome P450 [Penicillium longicatenatum]|uniref:Cytochrome P450 n=1 Tax=Penicillium longicatenatum TaxID=1561947 RepID=UPI0025486CFB|nr:Cytochrome P450 [Penicillium longicatenatum]KAJ5643641.1 Cytochrome P450 [Penicillium longicatenatum]
MSALTEFEPFVDKTIQTFFAKLDEFVAQNQICDIASWLQYYAFDVIGGSTGAVARFARARLDERLREASNEKNVSGLSQPPHRDFLARFLEAKQEHPKIVTDNQVLSYTISNMNAGSDTTAISLRAILYYTLKHPRVSRKLDNELKVAYQENRISCPVSWKQSQEELPYLDAVIKEALRLHPAVGLLLERVVPVGGLQLPNGGPFLPAGTVVGANPWIIHRHSCFGEKVDSFIPERWLQMNGESENEYLTRKQQMLRATFTFGSGPRTCIGKNISLLEIYKLVPSLFLTYKITLKDPEKEWTTVNAWFVRQKHMDVRLTHHN